MLFLNSRPFSLSVPLLTGVMREYILRVALLPILSFAAGCPETHVVGFNKHLCIRFRTK